MTLKNGIYESVINNFLDEEIKKLQENKIKHYDEKIDKDEGSTVLSKYMSKIIKNAFNRVAGED